MANCKGCNNRIDFDEKDKRVILGETLGSLDNALLKTPVFGKYAYVRRGRHYWHIDCYPDTLKGSFDQDKFDEELDKAIDKLKEESISKDALSKIQTERDNFSDELTIQTESIKRLVLEKEEAEKERTRFFDELSIYKIDNEKLKKDLVEFEKLKKQLKDLGINGTPK